MSNESNFFAGLIIGAVAGAVAGILAAPASGEETRTKIAGHAADFKDDMGVRFNDISERISNLENESLSNFREKFYDVKGGIKEQYAEVVSKVKDLEKDLKAKYKDLEKDAKNMEADIKNT